MAGFPWLRVKAWKWSRRGRRERRGWGLAQELRELEAEEVDQNTRHQGRKHKTQDSRDRGAGVLVQKGEG